MDISADDVREWHTAEAPDGNGWSDIGYHFVIDLDGRIETGRPLDRVGAHTKGHNKSSVGVAYVGGVDEDGDPCNTMNRRQRAAIVALIRSLRIVLGAPFELKGHNDFTDAKACPSFIVCDEFDDVVKWFEMYDARQTRESS